MKIIIKGVKYDTETAKELGFISHSHPGDFNWFNDTHIIDMSHYN